MLKRKMTATLESWKASSGRKALILLGARQTGKTYTVRRFAQTHYDTFIEVNFLEDESNGAFLAGSGSADELFSRLSLVIGSEIPAGSLIFFDEVQHLGSNIVTLSKFIVESGRCDLVLSGSLLGATLEGVASFPVGYAQVERMHPLDFEEFCWAMGVPGAILDEVRECYEARRPVEGSLHDRMVRLYRQYIVVGGMPEAVARFLEADRNLGAARSVGESIVEQYLYDISKYANDSKLRIRTIYENIPSQLDKENKRFEMMSIGRGATYQRLRDDFSWLIKAGVALPTYLATEPKYPLLRTKVAEKFKLYSSDCGLLLAQYPQMSSIKVVEGDSTANFGAVYENVVAQELQSSGFPLYYYRNSRKGELDFLLETKDGGVIPLEVKSGKDYKLHLALNNLLRTSEYGIEKAFVMSEHNVSTELREGKPVHYLPLYMTLCLKSERDARLGSYTLEKLDFG